MDVPLIVVSPFVAPNDPWALPGAVVIRATCGHLAWLSTEGAAFREDNPEAVTRCVPCTPPKDYTKQLYTVPGAVEAVRELLPDEDARESFNRFLIRNRFSPAPDQMPRT
jgi:hypothetical protein